jgi:hypothetical protein
MTTLLHRRKFLVGLLAAPAIVHAGNLMPIKALKPDIYHIIPAADAPFGPQGFAFHPPDDLWPRILCPPGHIPRVPRHWIAEPFDSWPEAS